MRAATKCASSTRTAAGFRCPNAPIIRCASSSRGRRAARSITQRNSATFLKDGKAIDIAPEELMATAEPYYIKEGYDFVAYPNRNSVASRRILQCTQVAYSHSRIAAIWREPGVCSGVVAP